MWLIYYTVVLKPYKYAGYPMLITTIERETSDDDLFSKSAPILTASSELAYHTMNNSALNAEELRRENGIPVSALMYCHHTLIISCTQILQAAFARCVSVTSASSKETDMAIMVSPCWCVCV